VISKYFPFVDWQHVIIAYHKQMVYADFIIDDAPQNLVGGCQRYKILIDMPHNEDFTETCGVVRLHNWEQIEQFITYMSLPNY
jgi:5'(3')-deoxyribonucleotidase